MHTERSLFVNSTAFLEFKSETVANKAKKNRQGLKIQGRVLFVGGLGESPVAPKVSKPTKDENTTKGKLRWNCRYKFKFLCFLM